MREEVDETEEWEGSEEYGGEGRRLVGRGLEVEDSGP